MVDGRSFAVELPRAWAILNFTPDEVELTERNISIGEHYRL
jgi:hypothetical protein